MEVHWRHLQIIQYWTIYEYLSMETNGHLGIPHLKKPPHKIGILSPSGYDPMLQFCDDAWGDGTPPAPGDGGEGLKSSSRPEVKKAMGDKIIASGKR